MQLQLIKLAGVASIVFAVKTAATPTPKAERASKDLVLDAARDVHGDIVAKNSDPYWAWAHTGESDKRASGDGSVARYSDPYWAWAHSGESTKRASGDGNAARYSDPYWAWAHTGESAKRVSVDGNVARYSDPYWAWAHTGDSAKRSSTPQGILDSHCVQNSDGVFCAYSSEEVAAYHAANPDHGSALIEGCYEISSGLVCAYHLCEGKQSTKAEGTKHASTASLDTECVRTPNGIFCTYTQEQVATFSAAHPQPDAKLHDQCSTTPLGAVICAYHLCEI